MKKRASKNREKERRRIIREKERNHKEEKERK